MMTSLAERAARCAAAAAICLSLLAATAAARAQDAGQTLAVGRDAATGGEPVSADLSRVDASTTDGAVPVPADDTMRVDASVVAPVDDAAPVDDNVRVVVPPQLNAEALAGSLDGAVDAMLDAGALDAALADGSVDAGLDDAGLEDAGLGDAGTALAAAPVAPAAARGEVGSRADASNVVKTLLGLVALLALAMLGAHPRVRRLERMLGISQVVTAGFPFVAMGLIARHPDVGVLNDTVLRELDPLLQLGLGWIGFLTGYQFEVKQFEGFPRGTARLVVLMSATPFIAVVVACGGLVLAFGQPWESAIFLRDAIVLGTAATITSPIAASVAAARGVAPKLHQLVLRLGLLDDIAGVVGLLFLGAYFRPVMHGGWVLPGTAWLFVTLGLGMTLGILLYVVMRSPVKGIEQITLVIGSIAFAAGCAGYLHLSPVVVCFISGAILGNLPGDYRQPVRKVLRLLERPIYLVFLVFAGALWRVGDWRGWVLMPAFVVARLVGRAIGLRLARRGEQSDPAIFQGEQGVVGSPMGALSIAIVVSFQSLFSGRAVPWIVTAVIGGAMVTEVFVQVSLLGGSGNGGASGSRGAGRLEVR